MAVVGLGGVGMNALLGGVVAGAERIVAVDLNADKLRLARELGATDTFLAGNADVVEEIRQATGGGLDYVIETAGSIPAMNLAYAIAARGGTVVSAGLPATHRNVLLPALGAGERREKHPGQLHGQLRPET